MAKGSAPSRVVFGWTRGPDRRPEALWLRVESRTGSWRLTRPPEGCASRPVPGGTVLRIPGSDPLELQLTGVDGTTWPDTPIRLEPPSDPALAWWDV
jgi:hypothetical protein